jgi:stress response protein YsnF
VSKRGRPKKLIQLEKEIETPLKQNEISIRNDVIIEQKTTNDDSVLKNEITASGDIECVVEPLTSNLV